MFKLAIPENMQKVWEEQCKRNT